MEDTFTIKLYWVLEQIQEQNWVHSQILMSENVHLHTLFSFFKVCEV